MKENNLMNFPEKLKELRLSHNLTQQQLAKLIEIHPTTYRNYESGKTVPRVSVIRKLAITLNVTCDELLGLD